MRLTRKRQQRPIDVHNIFSRISSNPLSFESLYFLVITDSCESDVMFCIYDLSRDHNVLCDSHLARERVYSVLLRLSLMHARSVDLQTKKSILNKLRAIVSQLCAPTI